MIDQRQCFDIVVDPEFGTTARVLFNSSDVLKDAVCPNPECGRQGTIVQGTLLQTNEKFGLCSMCEYGYRIVPKGDIC